VLRSVFVAGDRGDGQQGLPDRQSTDNLDPALLAMMRQQEALQPAVDLLSAEMKS
jgi:hypothetical protein